MIGRQYTVVFGAVSVTAQQDFFEISPADDKPIKLAGLTLDNVGGTADAGDTQEEMFQILVRRGHTVSGSGGTGPTPVPLSSTADPAAGFAAEVNNTTIANTGTTKDLKQIGWNVRSPLREFWPDEIMPGAGQGDTTIVVRLLTTPADAILISGTLYVVELG